MDDGEQFYPTGLIRLVVLLLFWIAVVLVPLIIVRIRRRRKQRSRGFEVKLNTGETPVLREKENDHG